jgi:hypothetical protein
MSTISSLAAAMTLARVVVRLAVRATRGSNGGCNETKDSGDCGILHFDDGMIKVQYLKVFGGACE